MGITVVLFIATIIIDFMFSKRITTKKDIIFYSIFMILTFAYAVFYFSNPYRDSFVAYLFSFGNWQS